MAILRHIVTGMILIPLLSSAFVACDRGSSTDMKVVDTFLRDLVQKRGGGKIEIDPVPLKGDFGNLAVVRFYIEAGGNKVPGIAFVSKNRILLGGTLMEMPGGKDLSQELAGKPIPIVLNMGQFSLGEAVPRGPKNAKTILIEFSDFQCPFCRQEASVVNELLKKYSDEMVMYYKHFPLPGHPLAMKMAVAAECAKIQRAESFWTFHDHFLAGSEFHSLEEVRSKGRSWARADRLNESRWLSCYDKNTPAAYIQKDMEEGKLVGVSGTPSFIINGRMIVGAVPIQELEAPLGKGGR